ncbi:ImpA family metalloprotease [Vibrio aestuarianus]|nr:ImpA family metalloprotease [Vibrio aestuarianus]
MRHTIMFTALSLALTGCDRLDSSGGDSDDTTRYTAKTEISNGGRVSPASLSIEAGKLGSFTVNSNTGFILDTIEGCDGSLQGTRYTTAPMNANCSISANFITNAANAIRHRDHSLASDTELISHARDAIATAERARKDIGNDLYQDLSQISWYPGHDSITFNSFLPERTHTLLPANKDGNGQDANRGLLMVSEEADSRSAAMAANLFSVNTSTDTDRLLKRLIGWLTQGRDQAGHFNVVTAHIPSRADSSYFPHNEDIRHWFENNYPDTHSINEANVCDYNQLSDCIDSLKPNLIILSDIDRNTLGYKGITAAIAKAKAKGIPLLLSNYKREASPMLSPLYQQMGLVTYGNYWPKLKAENLHVADILSNDANLEAVERLLANLDSGNFDTLLLDNCNGNFLTCNETDFIDAFKAGADWLRSAAITLDNMGQDALSLKDADTLHATVLLSDKYRAGIDYPISWQEHQSWQQAMFADWLVNYARKDNLAQPDLGEYVTDKENLVKGSHAHYTYPTTVSEEKTVSVPYANQWTTTGWYILPGQTVTLSRLDSSDARVEIKLNYHRRNTNRAYEQKVYRGPLELATQRLRLETGQTITFSSPYGGPLYLYLGGSGETLSTKIKASGVTHHPSILNFNDDGQIATFNERLTQTELPHVDLRTDGAEQHMRRDRFTNAIDGAIPSVNALLKSISDDHINAVYTLAGFKVQGKTLSESLPSDVKTACVSILGSECLDEALHTRNIIQHANYDQNAHCGSGCSGNPWDAAWNINPTGWGDNHELGHNLQTNRLNVQYANASDTDNWSGYSSRAAENSNNIFPYVVKWQAHYLRDGNTMPITDSHMNHKDLFYVFMSDAAGVKNTVGSRVILNANCKVMDAGSDRYEAPWKSNNYAVHNGYRMAFYIQMALRAHNMILADGTHLSNGYNIFTLLYQHQRIFDGLNRNATDWDDNKERLGFDLFPFQGHDIYGGKNIRDIPGNDFMLVSLSKLTSINWQSHFDMLGLRYSSLAAAQAQANSTKGELAMGMYQLETDLPPANMSEGLTFIPLALNDNSTQWHDNSSPLDCPPVL